MVSISGGGGGGVGRVWLVIGESSLVVWFGVLVVYDLKWSLVVLKVVERLV